LAGALASCEACHERPSRYAAWTCGHCAEPRAEAVAEPVWRALFARRLARAGVGPAAAGLDFWELTLLALIEEENHDRDLDRHQEF
jgi:hypothetical protein